MTRRADTNWVPSRDALSRELDGEEVILHLRSGLYFGLDPVGAKVWRLLQEGLGPSAIAERLRAEYAVSEDRARRDVSSLLKGLERRGLIERA